MSKVIEIPEDLSELSEEDAKYLHDRGRISDAQLAEAVGGTKNEVAEALKGLSEPTPLDQVAHTGDANTAGLSVEQLEDKLAGMREEQAGDDEDDALAEEPYEDVKNDLLRAEIVRRNEGRSEEDQLSLEGNKSELIATLREDDETGG